MPTPATEGSSGMDLRAAIERPLILKPGARSLVPTGIALAIPKNYEIQIEAQIRPRSGLAVEHGLTVLNAPGTIDSDYRGELKVVLINLGSEPLRIENGMRIAQLVFAPVIRASFRLTQQLPGSERGEGGFGHTGL